MGEDIGQNRWIVADEQGTFIDWLGLDAEAHSLDVACVSGGPTVQMVQQIPWKATWWI